jgi:hypothetical protein
MNASMLPEHEQQQNLEGEACATWESDASIQQARSHSALSVLSGLWPDRRTQTSAALDMHGDRGALECGLLGAEAPSRAPPSLALAESKHLDALLLGASQP